MVIMRKFETTAGSQDVIVTFCWPGNSRTVPADSITDLSANTEMSF